MGIVHQQKKKCLAYIRVSTESQGESGIGIEIQKVAIKAFANATGFEVTDWIIEVGTGTGDGFENRPRFRDCSSRAQRDCIPIVVKDISRITRSLATMRKLQEDGVEILVAENGGRLNRTAEIVHAAVAEEEAKAISSRTKEGLSIARAAGKRLGNPEALRGARGAGLERRRALRDDFASDLRDLLKRMGLLGGDNKPTKSLREITRTLNDRRVLTRHRKQWSPVTIRKALEAMGCDLSDVTRSRVERNSSAPYPEAGTW